MEKNSNYFKERERDNIIVLNQLMDTLPDFCAEYFIGIEQKYSILTRVGYARDFQTFFYFLVTEIPIFKNKEIIDLTYDDLNKVTVTHLERYLSYLSMYTTQQGNECMDNENAKLRKISSIRSLFKYLYNKGKIKENVSSKIIMPKLHEKEIIRLEADEIDNFLETVEKGTGLSKREQSFHKKTQKRDLALTTLLLGTGIRISECVGLNIDDIDFDKKAFQVTRKGGNRVILYFSDEVRDVLFDYFLERIHNENVDENEKALFLSMQNKRISVRACENLVKKYAKISTPLKNISPHKLRSSFGTQLYRETRDIYVVAEVLGHSDVNTTKKHYAAIGEDIRKNAADVVTLRKDD